MNGWSADAGGQLIPPHEEDSGNEELYAVVRGRATFTVGEETADAPAGTLIFVPPLVHRTAHAAEDATIVFVVGASVGEAFDGGGWDTFAVANGLRQAGRMDECRALMEKEIEKRPEMWELPYNAACLEALSGNADEAVALLQRTLELNREEIYEYLRGDSDLDGIRDDERFRELLG